MSLERQPPLEGEVVDDDAFDADGHGLREDADGLTGSQLIAAAPAMARLAGGIWWRATRWSLGASARTGGRLARAAADPVLAGQIVDDLARELREYARDLLGVTELERRMAEVAPDTATTSPRTGSVSTRLPRRMALRVRGARLLRASAQLDGDDQLHPAYARILTELAADEARILRLLATDGPQPMVDVRAANLIGGSQLIARGLTMVGAEAGCLHRERVPAYLNNLERLGLVSLTSEPVDEPAAYQVLEAQPDVLEAIHKTSRAKTDQHAIELTAFGTDFCDTCLPTDITEMEALAGTELERLAAEVVDDDG